MNKRNTLLTGIAATSFLFGTAYAAAPESHPVAQATDDGALLAKVKTALIENDNVKARQIDVEVYQGQVQLLGFVDTAAQKAEAGRVASSIAGAKNVKNALAIQQADHTTGDAIDDTYITTKVKSALIGDSRTKAHQIEVTTSSGVVQLGGFVDSAAEKSAASEVAQSIKGVKSVQNKLQVK